jgi:hypothetical protein
VEAMIATMKCRLAVLTWCVRSEVIRVGLGVMTGIGGVAGGIPESVGLDERYQSLFWRGAGNTHILWSKTW